jgi:membrane protein
MQVTQTDDELGKSMSDVLDRMSRRTAIEVMREPVRIAWSVISGWLDHRCASLSAALAFYTLFSLAPMLLIIIALAGYFFGADATSGQLYGQLRSVVGPEAASFLQSSVESAWKSRASNGVTAVSVIAVAVSASVTFAELKSALNIVFDAEKKIEQPYLMTTWALVKARLLSFTLVSGLAFLLIVSLLLDAGIAAMKSLLMLGADTTLLIWIADKVVSIALLSMAFAVLLRVLPDVRVRMKHAALGGAFASLLFVVGKSLFGVYLTVLGTTDVFGAAGSMAVLLMWLFYSSAVFLLGAELVRELEALAQRSAKRAGERTHLRVVRQAPQP